ncbi:MAG TPA: PAS domain-containing sensor histidine kinase [Burkholderiales bacterium]|nr:PAS domain-containing sensor histidine kinase [Burkholderiales bacterium]
MRAPDDSVHESDGRSEAGNPLTLFGAVLAVGVFTVLAALVAGLSGFYRHEMYAAATVLGALVMLLAIVLFYHQTGERRASDAALQSVRARVGDIVDSAMDAVISTDESQRIVLYNPAAERMFGWPRAAVLGHPLDMLVPERFRRAHQAHVAEFGRTGATSRRMGAPGVLFGLRADGEEFPIEASISQHGEHGGKILTVILRDVTERARADEALRKSREELRELSAAAHSIREQEQRRVAREIHDELGQSLTALKMDVGWLLGNLPAGLPSLFAKLDAMQNQLDETVAATRRISADLRPLMLDDLGLIPAAEWLGQNFSERTGIPCTLHIHPPDIELAEPHASALYRILQESLTNVARHAKATRVEVTLERAGGTLLLTVRDDGRGFRPAEARARKTFGLLGLRERTLLLGGETSVASEPGQGTTVSVRIPLEPDASRA